MSIKLQLMFIRGNWLKNTFNNSCGSRRITIKNDFPKPYVQHVETFIPPATPKIAILKPTSNGKRRNGKACFVCKSLDHLIKDCDYHEQKMAQPTARNHAQRGNPNHYARMLLPNPQRHVVPAAVLTQSKLIPINAVRPVSTVVPKISVTKPRQAKTIVSKTNSPHRRHIDRRPSPKASTFPPKVTAVKAPIVNAAQMCDKKNSVLFTDTECLVLSLDFKLPDANQVLLRDPRENNMYNVNLKNIVHYGDLTSLFAKKGKQHRASCRTKPVSSVNQPLYRLHMDLFGPTFAKSLNKKSYCLVVTDDYSRFTWVFFLATKDETSPILKTLSQFCGMKGIKREFSVPRTPQQNGIAKRKNRTLIEAARTMLADSLLPIPFWAEAVNTACYVQNRVLGTKPYNKTPYELLHGRTPSFGFMRPFGCPVTILNTLDSLGKYDGKVDEEFLVGYYVNSKAFRVFNSRTQIVQETLHVNFLENKHNVAGVQDKFDAEKAGEEIIQQYVLFPVWSSDRKNLMIYLRNMAEFKMDYFKGMNYDDIRQIFEKKFNSNVAFLMKTKEQMKEEDSRALKRISVQDKFDAEKAGEEIIQQYVLFPVWSSGSTNPQNTDIDAAFDKKEPKFKGRKPESEVNVSPSNSAQSKKHDDKTKREAKGKSPVESLTRYRNLSAEFEDFSDNSINKDNTAGILVPAIGQLSHKSTNTFSATGPSNAAASPTLRKSSCIDTSQLPDDPNMSELEDITYCDDEDDVGAEADFNNLETSITVSPIPTTRVHKDHHVTQIIGDLSSATQTRSMTRVARDQGGLSQINNDDFYTCMFSCFLSQEEPKRVHQALKDLSWIEVMQEELLQFKMQKEEGINYEEVFAPVERIKAIRLFLAYASFMGFMVYQMNVKSAFLYENIKKKVYIYQPLGFEDPDYSDKVYKVVKTLYGLHQAPRAWYETLANYLLENSFQRGKIDQTLFIKRQKGDILLVQIYVDDIIFGLTNKDLCKAFEKLMKDKFQMSSMEELTFFLGLQVKQKKDGIFISQDKYVAEILRKFGMTDGKSASTPTDTEKPLLKDPDGEDGKPHLGLWYPKDSPFNLVAYSDSKYAGASLDRKSTIGGCQFLGCRLISWQCKKQTVVATSSTEAEYVAAASCCAQVL
uniref:Integrase catalytic domain-containing protein n=1 Tax=Tanacetum cinerariifolium TaxID=118510 RepID=A0A6L2MXZ3_TANCI|nr:hypothetical protein [Tanacetum cinerariifolium]